MSDPLPYLKEFNDINDAQGQIEWVRNNPEKAAGLLWYLNGRMKEGT